MNTICYLIRHGEVLNPLRLTYGRVRQLSLSETGKYDITALAHEIADHDQSFAAIYSSPARRTVETTEVLLTALRCNPKKIFLREQLTESDSSGYVGRPFTWAHAIKDMYSTENQRAYNFTSETPLQIAQRVYSVIEESVAQHPGQVVALVSHGDPLCFATDFLLHRMHGPRNLVQLKEENIYLLRGEAWRVEVTPSLEVVSHTRIFRPVRQLEAR